METELDFQVLKTYFEDNTLYSLFFQMVMTASK